VTHAHVHVHTQRYYREDMFATFWFMKCALADLIGGLNCCAVEVAMVGVKVFCFITSTIDVMYRYYVIALSHLTIVFIAIVTCSQAYLCRIVLSAARARHAVCLSLSRKVVHDTYVQ
jgi:hypothetical protein